MKLVDVGDFEAFSSFFKGKSGHRRAEFVMRLLAMDKVNSLYNRFGQYTGPSFTSKILDDVGIKYVVGNADRLRSLPEGPFITVSNHPYGHLDGIISIDLFASIRPDYRFMVNKILSMIKTLNGNFISVTPTGNKNSGVTNASLRGIRNTIEHIRKGHPVGFFPSGAVSDFRLIDLRVRDRKWQQSILHVIHSAKVSILPLRFFDKNSPFFYFLGLINWRIRLLRLPSEVFNKKGKQIRIAIGNIISVDEQAQFKSPEALGVFLRKVVYTMPLPSRFIPAKNLNFS